jgi:acyl-CoA dehydrogenase
MSALPEITLSEEETLLRESARELLAKRCDFATVRRWMATESGYDPAFYREIAELGWLGLAVPAEYGGAGLPIGALASVAEPMGRQLLASPFLATTLAAQALLVAGNEAQKQRFLPKLTSGEIIGSIALSEPNGSYGLEQPSVRATPSQSGLVLSGVKTLVLDLEHADFVVISASLEARPALFLVETDALVGRIRREVLIDETRRSARLDLNGLQLDRDAMLSGGDARDALRHVERVGWLLLSAEMAGGAQGVMELTLEYLRTRKQFGKLIGSYQALKHPMVEILCAVEQGRSLLYHAATAIDRADQADNAREIALRMAKAQLGETYAHAADRAIQFHGAIGFTYECHAHLFLRRAQWAQHTLGDSLHHRRRLAELLWPRERIDHC